VLRIPTKGVLAIGYPGLPDKVPPRLAGTTMKISRFPCRRRLDMPGSMTTRGRQTSRECDVYHVAVCWSGEHRHLEFVLRRSIPGLLIPLSMLHDGPRRSPRMTRDRCGSLRPAPRRTSAVYLLPVYPAHPGHSISGPRAALVWGKNQDI